MALTSEGTFININMVDYQGNKSSMRIVLTFANLDALNTGIAGITGENGLLDDLAAVTDLAITSVFMGEKFSEEGFGAEGSEAEEVAVISAKIVDRPGVYASLRIPGPKATLFLPGPGADANLLDREDAAVVAWLANFEAGGVAYTSDGEHIEDSATVGNWKGRRVFRHSRRR
jgi:hypothetical protein